jgi:phosphosulfolactate phosphohydrolase-like enzyme
VKNNLIGIYDYITGENIVREMTVQEQAERDAEVAVELAIQAQAQAEAATKAAQRQALLERLGLTEDEARLLLG